MVPVRLISKLSLDRRASLRRATRREREACRRLGPIAQATFGSLEATGSDLVPDRVRVRRASHGHISSLQSALAVRLLCVLTADPAPHAQSN